MRTLIAAALLPMLAAIPLYAAETGVSVRLAEVKGSVSARAASDAAWIDAKNGTMMAPGGEVKTGPGASVVLAFSDGNKVKLDPLTTFGIDGATTLKTSLRLFTGRLSAWVRRANKADFSVRHSAGVAAVRGTKFVMAGSKTEMTIELFEGALDVVDSFGRSSSMSPRQNVAVTQAGGVTAPSPLPAGAQMPPEPTVEAPPPPDAETTTAAAEVAPESTEAEVPPESTVDTTVSTTEQVSPVQESAISSVKEIVTTPVSPSAP